MRHVVSICLTLAAVILAAPLQAAPCDGTPTLPEAARFFVLAEGDSITFGQGSSDGRSYVQRSCLLSANRIAVTDAAKSRATLGAPSDGPSVNSLYGRLEDDARLLFDKRAGRAVVLTVLIGRNDLVGYGGGAAAYADDLARYIAVMRGAGADRVVVGTLLPSDWAAFVGPRAALNAILRKPGWAKAHGIDALADFAASPVMGPDAAAADKSLFADGIHPTDRGYALLAPIYGAAVEAAMRVDNRPR